MISDEGRGQATFDQVVREGLCEGLTVEVKHKAFEGRLGGAVC